ncbi:MAG: hypothetical protein PF505_07790, partial [Vallitaleaceae bacterium]|nr:hypothetical protein [Vallitaleaceae bacterium]
MKKMMKRLISVICALSILVGLSPHFAAYGMSELKVGDYVLYGRYEHEPILWQVINIDAEGNPLLFSDSIISYKAFDAIELSEDQINDITVNEYRNEYGNNNWALSNIREWLNSDTVIVEYTTSIPSETGVSNGDNAYDYEKGFLA